MSNDVGRIDVNFIRTTRETDLKLFFDNEEAIQLEEHQTTLAHLLAEAKILKSVSEGRRNGWNKPIPKGFNQFVVGKLKGMITIFNEDLTA